MSVGGLLKLYKEEVIELLTQQFIELKPVSNADIRLVHDTNNVNMIIFWKGDSNGNIILCFNLLLLKNYTPLVWNLEEELYNYIYERKFEFMETNP